MRLFSALILNEDSWFSKAEKSDFSLRPHLDLKRPSSFRQEWTTLYRTSRSILMTRTKFALSTQKIPRWPKVWLNNVTISFRVINRNSLWTLVLIYLVSNSPNRPFFACKRFSLFFALFNRRSLTWLFFLSLSGFSQNFIAPLLTYFLLDQRNVRHRSNHTHTPTATSDFGRIVDEFIELFANIASEIDKNRIKAFGTRNLLYSFQREKESKFSQLHSELYQKQAELEELKIEHQSLKTEENEQEYRLQQLTFQK